MCHASPQDVMLISDVNGILSFFSVQREKNKKADLSFCNPRHLCTFEQAPQQAASRKQVEIIQSRNPGYGSPLPYPTLFIKIK
jgi:hypothetical protein